MMQYTFDFGGFQFGGMQQLHDWFSGSKQWIFTVENVSGFSGVPIRESEREAYGRHGIVDYNSFFGKRALSFTGLLKAKSEEKIDEAINFISSKLSLPAVYSSTENGYKKLLFWNEERGIDAEKFFCNAKISSSSVRFEKMLGVKKHRKVFFQMKCEDPFFYSENVESFGVKRTFFMGGCRLPLHPSVYGTKLPLKIEAQSVFRKMIVNSGNFEVHPIITIKGPTKNPIIKHVDLGIFFKMNLELGEGEKIIVNTHPKQQTIFNEKGENMRRFFDMDSRWIFLLAGKNNIDFIDELPASDATGTIPPEQVIFEFRNTSLSKG